MRVGIRTKFLLLVGVLLLIIFGTITVFQIRNSSQSLREDLFEESKAFATLATEPIGNVFAIYKDSGTSKINQEINEFSELDSNITNISVVDINGIILFSKNDATKSEVTKEQASTFEPIYQNNPRGALSTIVYPYFEASGAHRYSVVYAVSDKEIEMAVQQEAVQLLYFGLASLLATMALVYLLINRFILKPIQQVSQEASVISAGNLEQQILVRGHDEIATLGVSVNKMAESLKADIAKLQEVDKIKSEFMMITSHNLRTPLTIINGYLDNLKTVIQDPEKVKSALKRIGLSVKRLEVFAEDVLTISRFELGDSQLVSDSVLLSDLVGRTSEEFISTAEQKGLKFTTEINDGDTKLQISSAYIRSAIWNILDNASKFTKEGGEVKLSAKRLGDNVQISISDTGVGISSSEIPKLFTKFHRGTSTLTYDFEGTGIGLYASKVMVEKHGGKISVISEEGKGSTFTIELPVNG